MTLVMQRLEGEWRTSIARSGDPIEAAVARAEAVEAPDWRGLPAVERFAVRGDDTTVHLSPLTADRSVVARPIEPVSVPAAQDVTIFLSSPLWLRLEVGRARALLFETPIYRPSDTWFGPSPREGELCYATRAHFRVRRDEVPEWPHRAITAVRIHNVGAAPLRLERLNLAVLHLPVYGTEAGALWTPDVVLRTRVGVDFAPLEIQSPPPTHAPDAVELSPARIRTTSNPVVRAFSNLFHFTS